MLRTDFIWSACENAAQEQRIIKGIWFQPDRIGHARQRHWKLGVPRLLPKWKRPGLNRRLIIDKSRVIDVALDELPFHAHTSWK